MVVGYGWQLSLCPKGLNSQLWVYIRKKSLLVFSPKSFEFALNENTITLKGDKRETI